MRVLILALFIPGSVSAKPIAAVRSAAGGLVLDDEQKTCPAGTKAATFHGPQGSVSGCWFFSHGHVWMFFEDGDSVAVPERAFKWASTL